MEIRNIRMKAYGELTVDRERGDVDVDLGPDCEPDPGGVVDLAGAVRPAPVVRTAVRLHQPLPEHLAEDS